MKQNGVVELSTGHLLRKGFCDFSQDGSLDPGTEAVRTDVPFPADEVGKLGSANVDRWNGSSWDTVPQPGS
jgi:hypothetical protein